MNPFSSNSYSFGRCQYAQPIPLQGLLSIAIPLHVDDIALYQGSVHVLLNRFLLHAACDSGCESAAARRLASAVLGRCLTSSCRAARYLARQIQRRIFGVRAALLLPMILVITGGSRY